MAGSKQLTGIVDRLLGTFVSRNNDIYGYWGIGVLRLCADKNDLSKLVLDLIKRSPQYEADSPLQIAEKTYREWLIRTLAKLRIDLDQLEKAEIHLEFSTFDEYPNAIRDTRGEPYICTVILTNLNGNIYSKSKIGVCALPDPTKDLRSTRV